MTPRAKYHNYWYEISATPVGTNGSPWQGELDTRQGRNRRDYFGRAPVPGYFDTEPQALDAADAYARVYIDQL